MILSVIIVSYDVKYFLEQCLSSLEKAINQGLPAGGAEVFVVDNNSTDGSVAFLQPLFPNIQFIRNEDNKGFAKANNQILKICSGDFVLFLNPDTILAEDTLGICLRFFETEPAAGAIGVKMVDGAGKFLRESKRGFPGAAASFYKMTGISALWPRSKTFASYHMGHLSSEKNQQVEILSAAYMMVRKMSLEMTGGFDEQFFMYGEDIDLSWRIRQAGFQNIFLSDTTIIHFKGESTPKDRKHIEIFYSAMKIFIQKHFRKKSLFFSVLLNIGMRLRQLFATSFLNFSSRTRPAKPGRIYVRGTEEQKKIWTQKLISQNRLVVSTGEMADEIIYCEGPELTWKSIISEIKMAKTNRLYKFHGWKTTAAVGSSLSRGLGEVFEL